MAGDLGSPGDAHFFLVGGFANHKTLERMAASGGGYGAFVAKRMARLMKPVLVLLAVWIPLAALLQIFGLVGQEVLAVVTVPVSQPLWFIGVYLIVTALAPPFLTLHRRYRAAVPTILSVAAAAVDLARFVDFWSPHGRRLVVLPVSPASSVGVSLGGLALLKLGGMPPRLRARLTA